MSNKESEPANVETPRHAREVLSKKSNVSLVEQIVAIIKSKIDDKLYRGGARVPSIRAFSDEYGVSKFTVVEAYDRLVAKGYLDSRRGAGFFVNDRTQLTVPRSAAFADESVSQQIDIAWLVRSMFHQDPSQSMPGSGLLPADWMNSGIVGNSFRAVARVSSNRIFQYGSPQGYLPLRQQLQHKLASVEIAATPEQIVTTAGVTQGLDLIARHLLAPGDVVFVDDPAWFLVFGSYASFGVKVVGIPRLADGPDIPMLMQMAELHRPKMYVINSILHNPSSTSLSLAKAYQVLNAAVKYDFLIVEDDIYSDLHQGNGGQSGARIASLDQLERVIYLGGFSKTLAANLRVGFIACSGELARQLTDRKILSTLTTSEIGEMVVYRVLSEGHYRKHVERLRSRLDEPRERIMKSLTQLGLKISHSPSAGMFLWVDAGTDTNILATQAMRNGLLLAPGALFSPTQLPSNWMRINIAAMADAGILKAFIELMRQVKTT
jgi:DNA-binding transcriptional MocR family regulator